jgi:hypothetical protein
MITPETLLVSENTALSYQSYRLHATCTSRAGYGNAYSMLSCLIGVAFPQKDNPANKHSPLQILCDDDIYALITNTSHWNVCNK